MPADLWFTCSFHCKFLVVNCSRTFRTLNSFLTHPHAINLSLFLTLALPSTHDLSLKSQVITALKQMWYDKCQAVVMSDVCLREKVRLSAEETLVFMFEWMKCTPSYNPQLLSSSSFKMESCALRHVICNQWWDSEVRQQEVNQVLTGQSSQVSGNAGRRMMHAKKQEKEIKRKRTKEHSSSLYYLFVYLNSINMNSPYVFI